jgi:hypothetical protein
MQFPVLSAIAAALAILAPATAFAGGFQGTAKLAQPAAAPTSTVVNGVEWRCDGDTCLGTAQRVSGVDGFMRECRKVSEALGPLAGYASRGRTMSHGNLMACNKLAEAGHANQVAAK